MALQIIKTMNNREEFEARMKQGTFLVVDDFDSMRKVTMNHLRQLGASRILEAANGYEAMKILARQPVTLILSDWNMPVMNGFDLLLTLRSSPELFRLPFLMITAEAARERVTHAIQVGVSELLVKPYTAARLAERVEHALNWKCPHKTPIDPVAVSEALGIAVQVGGARSQNSPKVEVLNLSAKPKTDTDMQQVFETLPDAAPVPVPAPEPEPQAPKRVEPAQRREPEKPTILVVDDTPDNLTLLSHLFKDEYRVRIAHNGKKALAICQSDNPPDLILLDIMMPDMDGFEVAAALREHPTSELIPIIFVTAMTDDDARLKGMELGAVDFVTKPVDPNAMKIRVRNFMRYVELNRQLQADYDGMMANERLKQDVEHITRHDMKGPLAGLIGIVQNLAEAGNLTEEQRNMLQLAEETALQTLNMVNLSNELYKIETNRFVLSAKPVNVALVLKRLVQLARKTFAVRQLNITIGTPTGTDIVALLAEADEMLCYSLFENLIKNACEAAPDGSKVSIAVYPQETLQVIIENPGVVPVEIRDHFFDKYATAGKSGGTGIGTYSAKILVEAQNGRIAMETSDASNSTKITVSLPRPKTAA